MAPLQKEVRAGAQLVKSDAQTWIGNNGLAAILLDQSADCVKVVDADGVLTFMNKPGLALMEIENFSQIRGRKWSDCWPDAHKNEVEDALRVARGGGVARFSGFCPTSSGAPKWWDVVVSPMKDETDRCEYHLVISRDVTAQKLVEQRLLDSERRFRALADNMAQLAWMADSTGSIFWYNKRWYDFTGLSEDEARGWGWQKAHHPEHVDRVVKKISEHFARGDLWEDTYPLAGRDGEYRWFLSRANPIRDAHGEVVLWCGTDTDITEQREAGARLRRKARLIELSHEAILVWDLETGISMWNEGCENLYGYSRSEAMGARTHDLLKTRHDMSAEAFDQLLLTEGEWTGELLHMAKDGSEVWVDSRQELVRFGDRNVVLETNRDITERRRADETRNILLGELAHRVKNTLAIVQSIARQTARNSKTTNQFVASFGDRLQALSSAHNVLTETNWRGAELGALLNIQLAGEAAYPAKFDIHGPSVFIGSQTALQLNLIVHELASNARRHGALTRPAGRVAISWRVQEGVPRRLHLTWREAGGPPVSPPARHGFGLTLISRATNPQTVQAQVAFEPSGVVCHMAADLPEAAGTHGYFNPSKSEMPGRRRDIAAALPQSRAGDKRILIVEDEPLIAIEIEHILSSAGFFTVGPMSTAEAALDAIARLDFNAAVVDRDLLGNALEPIVTELQRRQIPFALVLAAGSGALPPALAATPCVGKPPKADVLVEVVRSLAKRKA